MEFNVYAHDKMNNDDDFGQHAIAETIQAADLNAALVIFNDKYDSNDYSLAAA